MGDAEISSHNGKAPPLLGTTKGGRGHLEPIEIGRFAFAEPLQNVKPPVFQEEALEGPEGSEAVACEKLTTVEEILPRKQAVEERLQALTGGKPIAKAEDPPEKGKSHYDYVLMEMMWMSNDFAEERRWKQTMARKVAKAVKQYHKNKANIDSRKAKQREADRKRTAARIGRDIKKFWSKIDKIVAYKQKLIYDEKRKRSMDQHLRFLVGQTEKYSVALASTLEGGECRSHESTDLLRDTTDSPVSEGEEEEEMDSEEGEEDDPEDYVPEEEQDDETTLAEAEKEQRKDEAEEEIAGLKDDVEVPIEELRAKYKEMLEGLSSEKEESGQEAGEKGEMQAQEECKETKGLGTENMGDEVRLQDQEDENDYAGISGDEGDKEFVPVVESSDDEETIERAERETTTKDTEEEIAALRQDSEVSIEVLRAQYAQMMEEEGAEEEEETGEGSDEEVTVGGTENGAHDGTQVNGLPGLDPQEKTSGAEVDSGNGAQCGEGKELEAVEDDNEFVPMAESSDDEATIAQAERETSLQNVQEEIAALQQDSEVPVEVLRAQYAKMMEAESSSLEDEREGDESGTESEESASSGTQKYKQDVGIKQEDEQLGEESDFAPESDGADDETTIAAAEKAMGQEEVSQEIEDLSRAAEEPLDELRARYAKYLEEGDEAETSGDDSEHTSSLTGTERKDRGATERSTASPAQGEEEETEKNSSALDAYDRDARAARIVPRPFLLVQRLKLREYQAIGLNWLVSMYERRLNGILADEMGLGKTIQTISLLAHLAGSRGIWGPHLIVVPTSCLVNWEMEFKRWCPGFKVLTYYGSAKRRKELRQGWTKPNAFHICITSYQLVVQDSQALKRKKWYFLILDEAHNIKNFKSQRWQVLLSFNSQRRLLLTGTPLQNDLMELWSLMHFLMPHVFRSRKEFGYWFSNPLSSMVEGEAAVDEGLVSRLHGVIRPFLLRRLKKDVEKQLPAKYEHIIRCKLSKRQRFLYEDFISRSSTRRAMSGGGNFLGMMNVLMQLRKVCNHPDLFEPRPIVSSFDMEGLLLAYPSEVIEIENNLRDSREQSPLDLLNGSLLRLEMAGPDKVEAERIREQRPPSRLFHSKEDAWGLLPALPQPPALGAQAPDDLVRALIALHARRRVEIDARRTRLAALNKERCGKSPLYGWRLRSFLTVPQKGAQAVPGARQSPAHLLGITQSLCALVPRLEDKISSFLLPIVPHIMVYVPRARSAVPQISFNRGWARRDRESGEIRERLNVCLAPHVAAHYEAHKRTQIFFPDKRLLQFDCGKLQELDVLLRELKRGHHRCLIFTQMSSMLDILEIFLNIHGHSYLRLDGSTKVEQRQRLMDKFNEEEKIFVFILSTRSGGLGINLTGADTVIFYDSDWNPAMDAQAQDRAHRIGQTRDVHIYRLISEHTVEENILTKANQKRHLDFLVMSKGKFNTEFFSKASLRELVGPIQELTEDEKREVEEERRNSIDLQSEAGLEEEDEEDLSDGSEVSAADVEAAMARLEDEDDFNAMKGAQKEAEVDDLDFAERAVPSTAMENEPEAEAVEDEEVSDAEGEGERPEGSITKEMKDKIDLKAEAALRRKELKEKVKMEREEEKRREKELEEEQERQLQAWRQSVSLDNLEASLRPIERTALHFREQVDPPWGWVTVPAAGAIEEEAEEIDVEEIERQKEREEEEQLQSGELIAGQMDPGASFESIFKRERRSLWQQQKRRRMTGESWVEMVDNGSGHTYFYDMDTHEATWTKPAVLVKREERERVMRLKYAGMPTDLIQRIARYLNPASERPAASLLCRSWKAAVNNRALWLHVEPSFEAEDIREREERDMRERTESMERRIQRERRFTDLGDAIAHSVAGDTLLLAGGLHLVNKLRITVPVRILGDGPNVLIRVKGSLEWQGTRGQLEGVTVKKAMPDRTGEVSPEPCTLHLSQQSTVRIYSCDVDHAGSYGATVVVSGGSQLLMANCKLYGAATGSAIFISNGSAALLKNSLMNNESSSFSLFLGTALLRDNVIGSNGGPGVRVYKGGKAVLEGNDLRGNAAGPIDLVDCPQSRVRTVRNILEASRRKKTLSSPSSSVATTPVREDDVPEDKEEEKQGERKEFVSPAFIQMQKTGEDDDTAVKLKVSKKDFLGVNKRKLMPPASAQARKKRKTTDQPSASPARSPSPAASIGENKVTAGSLAGSLDIRESLKPEPPSSANVSEEKVPETEHH